MEIRVSKSGLEERINSKVQEAIKMAQEKAAVGTDKFELNTRGFTQDEKFHVSQGVAKQTNGTVKQGRYNSNLEHGILFEIEKEH